MWRKIREWLEISIQKIICHVEVDDYEEGVCMWNRVEKMLPQEDGRYFILVDFEDPVMCLGVIAKRGFPMTSNYRKKKGWMGTLPEMVVTHWMVIPGVEDGHI